MKVFMRIKRHSHVLKFCKECFIEIKSKDQTCKFCNKRLNAWKYLQQKYIWPFTSKFTINLVLQKWLSLNEFIVLLCTYVLTSSAHENSKLRTCCVHKLFWHWEQFMYTRCSELVIFMYWTCDSMNNLLSYCVLVDARIRACDKDLPALNQSENRKKS